MTAKKTKPVEPVISAFKGFDKNLQCRGMQFTIGQTFTHTGAVKACSSGLHSCEYPLDVFQYYEPATSRFATVKASGSISRESGGDSKIASASLLIEAEIGIPSLVSHAVRWVMGRIDASLEQTNTGGRSAATNTGYGSAATNTGNGSAATNTGDRSAATNTGNGSAATNTGYGSAATNTGNGSAATNTGYGSAATNTGDRSAAEVSGPHAVACGLGVANKARASAHGAIVLCYRNPNTGHVIHIRASKVGENGIEADVWYSLDADGEFVKADA